MKQAFFAIAAGAAVLAVIPASAHHSHAMYDSSGEIILEGVITEVRWANPHVWLYFDVAGEGGEPRTWALEGAAIGQLQNSGWEREMLNEGDQVTVSCYPLRSGGPGCLGGYVLTLNGEDLPPTHGDHAGRAFD